MLLVLFVKFADLYKQAWLDGFIFTQVYLFALHIFTQVYFDNTSFKDNTIESFEMRQQRLQIGYFASKQLNLSINLFLLLNLVLQCETKVCRKVNDNCHLIR